MVVEEASTNGGEPGHGAAQLGTKDAVFGDVAGRNVTDGNRVEMVVS